MSKKMTRINFGGMKTSRFLAGILILGLVVFSWPSGANADVVTVVGWNFDDQNSTADSGLAENLSQIISRESGYSGSFTYPQGDAGLGDSAISSVNWTGTENTKYWQISFSSTGHQSLVLSSKQYSSSTGPDNFSAQYSTDGGNNWVDIAGTQLNLSDGNWKTISSVSLPPDVNDKSSVYLRWLADGSATGNPGTNRIEDIIISGTEIPDADSDGVYDSNDNCPAESNVGQEDQDVDGHGDVCDNCPQNANPDQADSDSNGIGDVCDTARCASDAECQDADVCNGVEVCDPSGVCLPSTPLSCSDADVCNGVETCDPDGGCVSGTPLVCNPYICDSQSGCLTHCDWDPDCQSGYVCGAGGSCVNEYCGDGAVNGSEQCDSGDQNGNLCAPEYGETCQYCSFECQTESLGGPFCGDGTKNGSEQCDDGNADGGDGCDAACQPETTGSISGFVFFDRDSDNQWDGWRKGETKMGGWRIFVDQNGDRKFKKGEKNVFTRESFRLADFGEYKMDKLPAGSYQICEVQKFGWKSTLPGNFVCQEITLGGGENRTGVNFGNRWSLGRW